MPELKNQGPEGSEAPIFDYEDFRDTIGTVDEQGKRMWVYPRKPEGRLHTQRGIVAFILLALLFAAPFLKVNGDPLFLFNILERKFIIFGLTFWPQDFFLFGLAMVTLFVFIVLFTTVFGRVWCGWACPQTIFMEMVFRKVEYWIEGDRVKQKRLNDGPWNAEKIRKKTLKLSIFALISLLISNLLMAYLIGVDELQKLILDGPAEHMGKFTGVVFFAGVFLFIFAWFREQACIAVCPYGRLQGVLLDKDSPTVIYDFVRGENRGRVKRGEDRADTGDCIDCGLCVQVCPTGIDIRNGTQMECVNCTACVDACNSVMDKVGFDRKLIRVDSYNGVANQTGFRITTRTIAYTAVLTILIGILGFLMVSREDIDATIIRTSGKLYSSTPSGMISNLYNYQVVNKSKRNIAVGFDLKDAEGNLHFVGAALDTVPAGEIVKGVFFLELAPSELSGPSNRVYIRILGNGELVEEMEISFLGPVKKRQE